MIEPGDASIRPLGTRLAIKRQAAGERVGSLIIPGQAQKPPDEGKIVAVGRGVPLMSGGRRLPRMAVGQQVLYQAGFGTSVKVQGEDFLLLNEADLLAVRESSQTAEALTEKCAECGHGHAGARMAYICVGCPCPERPVGP